jgi:hypothetical protein
LAAVETAAVGPGNHDGGAICNQGTLTLSGVTVADNPAPGFGGAPGGGGSGSGKAGQDRAGGGIRSSGTPTLQGGTTLQGNKAVGGNGSDAGRRGVADRIVQWGSGEGGNGGNAFGALYAAGGTVTPDNANLILRTCRAMEAI